MKNIFKTMSALVILISIFFSWPIHSNAASYNEEGNVSINEIMHVESYGSTPSGRITLKAMLTTNTYGQVVGVQSITTSSWNSDINYITWTPVQTSGSKEYAYCAVNYRYNLKFYTETIVFYP